jgi:phosphoglycerol transferase MdoB-like AlkP superfamily enzyme
MIHRHHFPENKIDLVKGVAVKSVKNAIKYADYAIGQFVKLAKKEGYYKDTIFVIFIPFLSILGNFLTLLDKYFFISHNAILFFCRLQRESLSNIKQNSVKNLTLFYNFCFPSS